MTNIISPAALKAAAKRIRDLESDRLGQKLSNTTILNALTQGLGLGQSFAAFTNAASAPVKAVQTAAQDEVDLTPAGIEASVTPELLKVTNGVIKDLPYEMSDEATPSPDASPAGVVTSPVTDGTQPCVSSGYIVLRVSDFENQPDGSLFNPKQQNAMRVALSDDWRISVGWAGNGLQIVSIDRFSTASSYADALEEVASTTEYLRHFIETNMTDVVKENPVIDHFSGVEALDQDVPKLRVSYHIKHGYEAEAQVSRTLWESAVLDVNKEFSEAEALIVLHETDKIHAQVTPEDIVIDKITQEAAAYTARKIKKEAPAPAKCTTGIAILYKVDQGEYDGRESAFTKEEEEAIEEDASEDWKLDIYPVMHGYQMIMLQVEHGKDEDPIATAIKVNGDADAVRHLIEHHAPGFVEDAKLINDGIIIPHRDDDKTLHVNFRYNSTDQICTGNVSEAAWDAFNQHLSVEDSLLMLAGDIEIDADYTAGEITVQDVMSKFELYVG